MKAASAQRVEMVPVFLKEIEDHLALEPAARVKPTPLFFIFHLGRLTRILLAPPAVGGGPPAPGSFASVDGACTNGPNDVQVVATDRAGTVHATSWNAAAGNYNPLVAVPV